MRFLHLNSHAFPPTVTHFALIILLVSHHMINLPQLGMAKDTLLPLQSVSVGETLTSAGQIFELGFFTPPSTTRTYIGIWYKNISQTILWVGNRENPLSSSDQTASLKLSRDGNLKLLDGNSRVVWSTNATVGSNTSVTAVLSDTGNLILKENGSELIAWESFKDPSDVILTTMQMEINTTAGEGLLMKSWRRDDDPAPGNFTLGIVPQIPVQTYIWNGSAKYSRSGPWNGLWFVGISYLDGVDYWRTWTIRLNNQTGMLYISTNQYVNSSINIMKLFPDGSLRFMLWNKTGWIVARKVPGNPCDVYGTCGKFGVCNPDKSPMCSCLQGFIPNSSEEWSKGNWTDGCVRGKELSCSKNIGSNLTTMKSENDVFWKLSRAKVPDIHHYLASEDSEECQFLCLSNCSCTAYAYVRGIGCMVWTGDLIDLQEFSTFGEDIFIRLAHSELLDTKKKNMVWIISLTVSLAIVVLSLFTYGIFKYRGQRKVAGSKKMAPQKDAPQEHESGLSQGDVNELPTIDFQEVAAATNDFSKENKIGEGGFGAVFRGKLQNGQEIAVKRHKSDSHQGTDEFTNEVLVISKLQHNNLVRILGCSIQGEELLIVYEYLPNGSLDTYLFDQKKKELLNWAVRINIIQSIARGLSYLHRDSRLRVIHRDLKASNILLDDDMNPKISDFGLARTFQPTQNSANTLRLAGTLGYMSPEYAMTGKFSEKSDVYSYGVLALEIVSGRKSNSFPNSYESNEDVSLVHYAWRYWSSGEGLEMVDKSLAYNDAHSDEILRCIQVGLLCTQDNPNDRPTMSKVVSMLSSETPLPEPKQSSFFPQTPSSISTSDRGNISSTNELTTSDVIGR